MIAAWMLAGLVLGLVVGLALGAARSSRRSAELAARLAVAESASATMDQALERISARVVAESSTRLAELAGERFDRTASELAGRLELRDAQIAGKMDPIARALEQYQRAVADLEGRRQGAYEGLLKQVELLRESGESLRSETRGLVTALRAPHSRGRWGEMQLRRVVEISGMVKHCDFVEQASSSTDDGVLRPDLVVKMPRGRSVVVDAKVPLDAYLRALDATDEVSRSEAMAAHGRQLRAHIDSLSRKAYWEQLDRAPEFVVCFVPGEGLLSAAFEVDPELVERAMELKVLLASPVTLIGLLRTIEYGWREEAMAESAAKVQALGQDLYGRLATMGDHLAKLGRSLNASVGDYNRSVASLESRVLVTARRFSELGTVGDGAKEIPDLTEVSAVATGLGAPELSEADPDAAGKHGPPGVDTA